MLIKTGLSSLSETGVVYRGYRVADLVERHSFEEVADLLWTGSLSTSKHRPWESAPVGPFDLPTEHQVRVICALTTDGELRWQAPGAEVVAAEGRALIATVVDSLRMVGEPNTVRLSVGNRRIDRSIASRFWPRLTALRATSERLKMLNTALICMADHELATSTFAVRVAASTLASPSAAVLAGLGAMQGALHGGASRLVRELLVDADHRGAAVAVQSRLQQKERIAGFGHKVYVGPDPRAALLLDLIRSSLPRHRAVLLADDLIDQTLDRIDKHPNVDLALAVFELTMEMEPGSAETIFTVARIAGWVAHTLEEYGETPLRFRARAHYTGPAPTRLG